MTIDDVSEGTEAGILSAETTISGRYAYGLLTGERGTHRLVRISPFDNQGRRQTSFAAVQVWPVIEAPDVELNDAEIRMEVFRASGAGGQHVNKTS
jgi:peptide chain release factor 2